MGKTAANLDLRVLGRASSINVRKVLWTCTELGLQPRHEAWGEGALSLQDPAFLALNPQGLVPVLVHGDTVLTESNTICRYLAQAFGGTTLLPAEASARAQVERWMDWQATELNNAWRYAFMALVRQSPTHQDPAAIDASTRQWHLQMALLNQRLLQTNAFVVGPVFTLADVVLGLSAQRWRMAPMAHPALPAVSAYLERLAQRPGFLAFGCNGLP